jgi:hypothetical protein
VLPDVGVARVVRHASVFHLVDGILQLLQIGLKEEGVGMKKKTFSKREDD